MRISTTAFATAVASLAVVTVSVAAVPAAAGTGPDPQWRASVTPESVISTIEVGGFVLSSDQRSVTVQDGTGRQLADLPLTFELDGREYALGQQISADGHRLTLTPDPAVRAAAQPVASPLENQLALGELAGKMPTATLAGTVGGTVIGLLVGAVIGFGSCLVVGPVCLATAPAALAAFAGAGGLAGTLLAGGGTLAGGLWKYLSTLQAAPGESAYAEQGGLLDPNGTGVPDANLRLPKIALPSGSSSLSAGH
ncbi:hypothetical protein [Nocardia sp. NPDC059239]|uniref:hypothetical protein n=1 Tax=unclassified Nocardia TaxID=2637762 RepID=UPI0036962B24